ncbi:MAG: high-affinity branched-chain amino acid ABC transporter permease LivM [Pseudomonadota bacterium]
MDAPTVQKTPDSSAPSEIFEDTTPPFAARIRPALKDAFFTGLIVLGLCTPIVMFLTRQDLNTQRLVLDPRYELVATLVAIAFVARLFWLLFRTEITAVAASAWTTTANATAPVADYATQFKIVGFILLLAYPLLAVALAGPGGALKWIDNYGIQILIYVMLGWGLNIVVGLAGLLDLGYVAFYAVGAYTTALLTTYFGFSFWICLPLAGVFAAFWGILLGFPVLRLRGDYLAIVTLAFGEIIRLVLINWVEVTGGSAGISGITRPSFFGLPFNASDEGFAAFFGLEFTPLHRLFFLFYLILALALLTNYVVVRMRRLPLGRAWEALREDEIACRSLGIDTVITKLSAFSIGAMFGGFAGAFFAARLGFISPESFIFMESAVILSIVVLGGMGSQLGVAIAAVVMIGGTEILRELTWMKAFLGPSFDPAHYRMLIFGLAMVAMMVWRPRGLISRRDPSVFLHKRKSISGSLVKEGHG